jgi:hypothetical protein
VGRLGKDNAISMHARASRRQAALWPPSPVCHRATAASTTMARTRASEQHASNAARGDRSVEREGGSGCGDELIVLLARSVEGIAFQPLHRSVSSQRLPPSPLLCTLPASVFRLRPDSAASFVPFPAASSL